MMFGSHSLPTLFSLVQLPLPQPSFALLTIPPPPEDITWPLVAAFVLAFALGSIPWGLIISRLFYKKDIREHGSGNIGTTNAMRTLGKRGGAAVFLLDFCKGLLSGFAGLLILWLFLRGLGLTGAASEVFTLTDPSASSSAWFSVTLFGASLPSLGEVVPVFLAFALAGCVLGHVFSPWLKFRGGKGIAVAVGCVFITFGWVVALIELAIFAVLVLVTRYVSVGSLAAALACPFFALWLFWGNAWAIVPCAIGALIIIWAHRGNIQRLIKGTEPRIGAKKEGGQT
jgi:glycerol-3-phosphate acyltransferase PlsY